MLFIDEVTLTVSSGDGGNGIVAWRREKFVPRGGPAGGNGGRGGHVVFQTDPQLGTLLDLRYRRTINAQRGKNGGLSTRQGANGQDAIVRIPVGTVIADSVTNDLLADLSTPQARWVAAEGGKGGLGNAAFATPVNRAPDQAEPGQPGTTRPLRLSLKLMADVGIIGMPNAGKSSLISRISNARPRIADYPFTTLTPKLGVVGVPPDNHQSFVVADIPGLIQGASLGAGLGSQFLKHVERTAVFLFLLAPPESDDLPDPLQAMSLLREELNHYEPSLSQRPYMVALNKIDLPQGRRWIEPVRIWCQEAGVPFSPISAITGEGISSLIFSLWHHVAKRHQHHLGKA